MIHRIYSDLEGFKELTFHEGLNLVLADKSPGATDRQTRNGAGKSSFVELLHFLTGANCNTDSIFRFDELIAASFGLEFDLGGHRVAVERSGMNPAKIIVAGGETAHWPISPKQERNSTRLIITNENWKSVLGQLIFGLGDDEEDDSAKFSPTFRSLFGYFARRQSSQGFVAAFQQSGKQLPWDQQVAISYLLGLDWSVPQGWQVVREKEKALETIRKAGAQGVFGDLVGKAAELQTQLTLLEDRHRQAVERVNSFRVLPQYRDLEREASELTQRLNLLANENALDRQLLAELKKSIESEAPPQLTDLDELYQEAGVSLPGVALRRYTEVQRFHESVVANRRSYLQQEQQNAQRRVEEREREKGERDTRRAEILNLLKTHGALEQFTLLQSEVTRLGAEVEGLRQRFKTAENLESGKTELELERGRLLTRLRQDYHEQKDRIKAAVLAFAEISEALYESPGSLTISPESNGPKFDVKIHAAKSKGISNMQIFCFDMMIARLCAERMIGPGFLVHDSHLFDGVDERQISKALVIGAEIARQIGWQYIVTMNSDAVPPEFDPTPNIVQPRLTDATESGGLFGVRFG
ncbi:MAG: ABC-three component system protein [Planctomycetales bacterium]